MDDKIQNQFVIDEKCGEEITATLTLFKIVFGIYLLWVIFSSIRSFEKLLSYTGTYKSFAHTINFKILPIAYLIQFAVSIIGIYFQFKGYQMQKKALVFSDSKLFTESYRNFRRGLIASLVSVIITIIVGVGIAYYESYIK